MNCFLNEYFKCPDLPLQTPPTHELSEGAGYFKFGENVICFGRSAAGHSERINDHLYDAEKNVVFRDSGLYIPFDPSSVIDNLHREHYVAGASNETRRKIIRETYYSLRPFLPLGIRKHLQRFHLSGWENIPFPSWPVDRTVDILCQKLLTLAIKATGVKSVPFIWFWPDGTQAAAVMTHDVETEAGRAFCSELMDVNDQFQMPASFQIVPEKRYEVPAEYLREIEERGFEINVQDLNHDGRLFDNYEQFVHRVAKINEYGKKFRAIGFRSAILYRNQDWFGLLDFEYDTSVPNVAHLDPQRGGCCTVMPYFVGNILELPVTMTQDHTLFHIFKDYSLDLWKRQTELVLKQNGMLNFIVHPDYIMSKQAQNTYRSLLEFLVSLRSNKNVWITKAGEVNRWWRQRSAMKLIERNGTWVIEGPNKERARVAYASLENGEIVYTSEKRTT